MSEMEWNTEVPTLTRDEALSIPGAMHEKSRGANHKSKGDLTSLRRHEQVPQVDTQLERNPKLPANSTQPTEFSPACLSRPIDAAAFQKKANVHSWNSKGYLTSFMKLQKFLQIPSQLERNIEFPTTS